jgi:4-diphosphocytidyl-2-C-methyl-D-erythritol kinase
MTPDLPDLPSPPDSPDLPLPSELDLPLHALAPAKINLGLLVGPTRADGRHELVTVMQSISLADELTLELAADGGERDELVCPGVDGDPDENLAARALTRFRQATGWSAAPLRLSIRKQIPVAAGLGGGSADAAAALRLAAAASGLGDHQLLLEIASELGADVPAQVVPGRWLATGAGELLEALPEIDPDRTFGVVVLPLAEALSTAEVYRELDARAAPRSPAELEARRGAMRTALGDGAGLTVERLLHNDLEPIARALCPAIDRALAVARGLGAQTALVSGSGPTVLGLFPGSDGAARARTRAYARAQHHPNWTPTPHVATPVDAAFGAPRDRFGRPVGHN